MADSAVIPPPHEDDDDDVAWALQTAAVQWQRGGKADAVVWLRRAVDAAIAAGNPARTKDLTRLASDVADRVARDGKGGRDVQQSESGQAVDDLLAGEPEPRFSGPPGPRVSAHSLSGEIPIEFEEVTDVTDDFEDEAETIPPPHRPSSGVDVTEVDDFDDVEQDVSGDDLFSGAPPADDGRDDGLGDPEDVSEESFVGAVAGGFERTGTVATGSRADDEVVNSTDFLDEPLSHDERADEIAGEDVASVLENEPPVSGVSAGVPDDDGDDDGDERTRPWSSPPPGNVVPSGAHEAELVSSVSAIEEPDPDATQDFDVGPTSHSTQLTPHSDLAEAIAVHEASAASSNGAPPDEGRDTDAADGPRAPMPSFPTVAPAVDDILLEGVRGFEDLPEEMQRLIVSTAELTTLGADDEVGSFGAALVTRGKVGIMPAVADVAAAVAGPGEVVFTRGTLAEKIPLRVVALEDGTVVASWTAAVLESAFADCPWVADELRQVADRFQALAGATLGLLGERLDETVRELVFSRLEVKAYAPGEIIVSSGKVIPGLHIVGGGRVELDGSSDVSPGEFLFAAEVLGGGKARVSARAGKAGALILFAPRGVAHELIVSVPPLLEILAG
jgi:CRP-like cAMP-binding protein